VCVCVCTCLTFKVLILLVGMPASIIVNLATHTFIYVSFNSGREDGIIYYLCLTESICNSDVKTKKKYMLGLFILFAYNVQPSLTVICKVY